MSEQLSPCSSGKSVSSEPGSSWNKGLVSCLRAICSRTQPAELAKTSKIPHRGKASPLASRCNNEHPAQYHNEHRSEHAKESVLNGSTHGEASKQTRSQDIMMKMKQLFNKTNTKETLDSECPSSGEILDDLLGGTITAPHFFTCDNQSSESEEDEDHDDLLASWQDTFLERDLFTVARTVSPSRSASSSLSLNSLHSLQPASSQLSASAISDRKPLSNNEYSLTPVLEQTREPHVAVPSTDSLNRGVVAPIQSTDQHLPELQSSWRTSQISLASPLRSSFCQKQAALVTIQEDAVHEGTSTTEDTLQSSIEDWLQRTSGWLDILNVEDVSSDSEDAGHIYECEVAQGGANAAQDLPSPKNSNNELVCRPKQRLLDESSDEEGGQCRICHSGDNSSTNPLLTPCQCSGSLRFVHLDCLKNWIQTRVQSGSRRYLVQRCELCTGRLRLDPNIFDWDEYFPPQQQQQLELEELTELYQSHSAVIDRALAFTTLPPGLLTFTSHVSRPVILPLLPNLIRIRLRILRVRTDLLAISDI